MDEMQELAGTAGIGLQPPRFFYRTPVDPRGFIVALAEGSGYFSTEPGCIIGGSSVLWQRSAAIFRNTELISGKRGPRPGMKVADGAGLHPPGLEAAGIECYDLTLI